MVAVKPIIVFTILFVLTLCDNSPTDEPTTVLPKPDLGSPEEFLKEVNEYRAKFAKEHRIPDMYKLTWSNELVDELNGINRVSTTDRLMPENRYVYISTYRNSTGFFNVEMERYKNLREIDVTHNRPDIFIELLNTLQTFVGCISRYSSYDGWSLICLTGFGKDFNFWYDDPAEAGSQCPPRFKNENGLCVPVDSSKHTFWGTEDQLLEDVNYMRRKYAKKFGIPNMHQLDGVGKSWRLTELPSFCATVVEITEAVYKQFFLNRETQEAIIRGKAENVLPTELIHPLQTSIGCMKKEQVRQGRKSVLTPCLLGNVGQWPTDWKLDANSKKIPGSECMDGYVNDDGLCVVAPPTTPPKPVPNVPKKPEEAEQEQSSSPNAFLSGLWIIYLLLSFF